jgi:uroporphyrinogen-III synthase
MAKEIEKLLEPLNLLYYEYDPKTGSLQPDAKWPREHILDELIKITHALTTRRIKFFVDEKQSVLLEERASFSQKIKRSFKRLYAHFKNSAMKIYVLSDKKVKWAKNLPVNEVKPLAFEVDVKIYDGLVFTSKNAIYTHNAQNKHWKKIPSYVIAPQSAKVLKSMGGNLKVFCKQKNGDAFAGDLMERLKGKRVLYVRGESVVSDLVNILNAGGVACDERVVYKTRCKEMKQKKRLPKGATIIFSSPSTIECFFKNMEWDESYKAIAIGKTTARYFPAHIIPTIADTTSLEACVKKAIELDSQEPNNG